MFNSSDSSGYPYLIPCVKGYAFSVSPLSMMFAIEFSVNMFYQTIEVLFYSEFVKLFVLNHEWMLPFIKGFYHIFKSHCFCSLIFQPGKLC